MSRSNAQIVVFKYHKKPVLLGAMNDSISGVENVI